jgi:hypothetical protein
MSVTDWHTDIPGASIAKLRLATITKLVVCEELSGNI